MFIKIIASSDSLHFSKPGLLNHLSRVIYRTMAHFKLIESTKASDVIPVKKYVSEKTGLSVIIANVEGPIVNGYFCLATEAHDDDGLPHTLEHLIFLGSKRYPYKGILDLLANRCMAHGTNAWTDTDHTCYTIDTAGDAGMLTLLPIYLDHILHPTLTDEGFITEVHHIDGEGEDAGVVYCEMQGRENSADSRCDLKLLRAMYPESGYSSETGGIMENLRISTDNTKVRNFHKKFYRPENLTLIITGQIEPKNVFEAISVVENDILEKRKTEAQEQWSKPWQTMPPPPKYGEFKEQWPSDSEDCGQILFGWRGPSLLEPRALRSLTSCAVLLRYLCDTAAAPLQRALVEREDALAGDVSYNLTENIAPLIKIELDNVPLEKLESAKKEALRCLAAVRSGEEPLDMDRMRRLIKKQLRECLASLEADPHQAVAFRCIGDALYSQNEADFVCRMNPQNDLKDLLKEESAYWMGMLKKYFSDELVTIVGSPSIDMQTRMADEERKRIEAQRNELGETGLAEKAKILKAAMAYNERPPPSGTIAAVPIPSCENFKCYSIHTWSSDGDNCPQFDLTRIPMYTRAHGLATNFVYINLIFDTTNVDEKTRKWLPILLNGLAECPVRRGKTLIPHEEVISTTEQLTVTFKNDIGFNKSGNFSVGQFGNFVHIETRCEPADYEEVVNHLYEVLYCAEITKERLLVFAQRLINDVAQVRRNGHKMVYDIVRDAVYDKNTNIHWCTVLRQQQFLKDLIEKLNNPATVEKVLQDAKETFANITKERWLHIATDFERYNLSPEPWSRFGSGEIKPPQLYWDAEHCSTDSAGGAIVGCGGLESSFVVRLAGAPVGYRPHCDAPIKLALNYFTQLEGPMWRLIRGCGLSYGYGIQLAQSEGRLVFLLYRAANPAAAFTKAKSIIDSYVSKGVFDSELFASARSTAIFSAVDSEKSPADVVAASLLSYLRRTDTTYNSKLVSALSCVTEEEVHQAAKQWLPALFETPKTKTVVVCHPSKVKDLQAGFKKIGVELDAYESMESSFFGQCD